MKKLDAVYCLNLTRRVDRWEKFQDLWKNIDIDIERFPAIDAEKINFGPEVEDEWHSKASLGCALSHIQMLERSLYCGHKEIMILEDDATPCENFEVKFEEYYAQLPEDYKFCFLGGSNMVPPEMITENIGRALKTKSTVAYLIKLEFAVSLIQTIKHNLSRMAVDEIYEALQNSQVFHILNPRLIHQFESYSDIIKRDIYYHWMRDI